MLRAIQRLVLVLAVLSVPSAVSAEYFTIGSYHSDIIVHPDSSFTVRESIEANFSSRRHGIYRDLPYRYVDSLGKKVTTPLEVLSVTDEAGMRQPYKVTRSGDTVRVRIGDPDTYVSGRRVYVLAYRVENAILFLDKHDELYWNVTGHGWSTTVDHASATVILDGQEDFQEIEAGCYTGVRGSTRSSCVHKRLQNGAEFSVSGDLKPNEDFTVVLGWEKGLTDPPSGMKRFLWAVNARENWMFFIPLLVLSLMFFHWRKKGRDPDVGGIVTVMYVPPEEGGRPLIPAEIGGLIDQNLDPRDITASIVNLAVGGYLTIGEKKVEGIIFDSSDHLLTKVKEADENLPEFERQLFGHLFESSNTVSISDLKYSFYRHIKSLNSTAFGSLKNLGYFTAMPSSVKKIYFSAGIAVMVLGGMLSGFPANFFMMSPMRVMAVFALSGLAVLIFAPLMPARTRKGSLAFMKVKGFEEFLSRAEKDRLERMKDKNLFEKYLPYAIALDVSDRWAKAFEGIYQEAPRWYAGGGGLADFHPVNFNHTLGGALSSMSSALYAAPRSSGGGGGGGFSGGGFGGGGGGSW